jgi:amino acid transporter
MVNLFSLKRYASRLQIFFTTAKLLAVLIVIFTGVYYLFFLDGFDNYKAPFQDSDVAPGNLASALFWGLWAYYGYDVLNGGIEEVKNPRR